MRYEVAGGKTARTNDNKFYREIGEKGEEVTSETNGMKFLLEIGPKGSSNSSNFNNSKNN